MAETKITRKDAVVYGGAAVGGLVAGGAAVAGIAAAVDRAKQEPAVSGGPISARYVSAVPAQDPGSDAWRDAQHVLVPLVPQQLVPPFLDRAGVAELVVSALHDGETVAFRLEWDDLELDDLDGVRRYHDAVAVQLPAQQASAPPAITMGGPGFPVHILQWRATWQRDVDSGGRTGVDDIYPEVVHDIMPDDVLPPDAARLYWVGREAGNPLSQAARTSPVEEVVAEGFGSVTHLAQQTAVGRGVHEDGGWRVVVALPAARQGVGAALAPGSSWPVAFAVWLGSDENRGGRKHYADWQTLVLEGAA